MSRAKMMNTVQGKSGLEKVYEREVRDKEKGYLLAMQLGALGRVPMPVHAPSIM